MGRRYRPSSLPRLRDGLGAAILAILATAILGAGVWLSLPRTPARSGDAERELILTMAGFTPRQIELRAGRPTRLRLVNPDSPYHTDGGGVHGFTVPDLAVDVEVPPRSVMEIALPAAPPGEYRFYCDRCCGGKDNPSMWGVLRVRA